MPYRNIFVASEAQLSLKNGQLIVEGDSRRSYPVEDIRSLVIDNPFSRISVKLLSSLGSQGVCVILCDERHTPCCTSLPLGAYCRALKRIELQHAQSKPHLKRLWQSIVRQKILNQARCLELNGMDSRQLTAAAAAVQSGDSTNREGYAARIYFKALFGTDFTRDSECDANAALNYGYAVFRSFLAKTVAAYGLEPSLGIHHKNQLNAFNLADDLIEPFRPIVDIFVSRHMEKDGFSALQRAQLQSLLNCRCTCAGQNCSAAKAAELAVQSLVACYESGGTDIKLPVPEDTAYFDYE